MKITDNTNIKSKVTTLNDIPVGTIFRGTVVGPNSGKSFTGIYFKADAGFTDHHGLGHDVCVVCLSQPGKTKTLADNTYANAFLQCAVVNDYEPLDIELVIKGAL